VVCQLQFVLDPDKLEATGAGSGLSALGAITLGVSGMASDGEEVGGEDDGKDGVVPEGTRLGVCAG
jgi:hypothetical protein